MSNSQRDSWEAQYRDNWRGDGLRPGGDVAPHIDWSRQELESETVEAAVARMCAQEMPHTTANDGEPQLKEQAATSATERRVGDRRGSGQVLRLVTATSAPPVPAAKEPLWQHLWAAIAAVVLMAGLGFGFWGGSQRPASREAILPAAAPVPTLRMDTDIDTVGRRVIQHPP
jgi:hypothetical protein